MQFEQTRIHDAALGAPERVGDRPQNTGERDLFDDGAVFEQFELALDVSASLDRVWILIRGPGRSV